MTLEISEKIESMAFSGSRDKINKLYSAITDDPIKPDILRNEPINIWAPFGLCFARNLVKKPQNDTLFSAHGPDRGKKPNKIHSNVSSFSEY